MSFLLWIACFFHDERHKVEYSFDPRKIFDYWQEEVEKANQQGSEEITPWDNLCALCEQRISWLQSKRVSFGKNKYPVFALANLEVGESFMKVVDERLDFEADLKRLFSTGGIREIVESAATATNFSDFQYYSQEQRPLMMGYRGKSRS